MREAGDGKYRCPGPLAHDCSLLYEALAAEHKQVETKFGNAKLRDADTLLRFIFLHVGAELPLRQTVVVMAKAGLASLSPMRLHKKMARAVPYLEALV